MRIRFMVSLIVLACGVPAAWAQPAASALTVLSRDGRTPIPITVVGNQEYVAVGDIDLAFGTSSREDRLAGGLTISARARSVVLTADQNVVSVGGRLVSLAAPTLKRDNRWLVSVDFLPRALSIALDARLDLRRAAHLLIVGDLRVPRVVARVDAGATNVSVVFEVTPNTEAKVVAQTGRLIVQFDADALELSLPSLPPQSFLLSLTPGDAAASVQLATGSRYARYRASTSQADAGSGRLSIDLLPPATETTAASAAPSAPALPAPPPDNRPPFPLQSAATGLRTVVIDPGHGGDEQGAQGPRGTLEKDVTLSVARRLRALIEGRLGLKVYLTRDDDRTLPLDDRSAFANEHKADVFLSIHANAAVRSVVKGAEVYYLTVERADTEARRRAEDTAAVLPALGGGTRTIDLILWETAQARYLEQSATLAGLIEQSLAASLEVSPSPVRQAPFRVLVGANMPAALVEIGYLTNPEQETQLASAGYQETVAQALFNALTRFREMVDGKAP